jgi:hypothetical protein
VTDCVLVKRTPRWWSAITGNGAVAEARATTKLGAVAELIDKLDERGEPVGNCVEIFTCPVDRAELRGLTERIVQRRGA